MIKKYWYAVDKDGQGWYYDNPPVREENAWNIDTDCNALNCANDLYDSKHFSFPIPSDMKWEDKPIEFQIDIG